MAFFFLGQLWHSPISPPRSYIFAGYMYPLDVLEEKKKRSMIIREFSQKKLKYLSVKSTGSASAELQRHILEITPVYELQHNIGNK